MSSYSKLVEDILEVEEKDITNEIEEAKAKADKLSEKEAQEQLCEVFEMIQDLLGKLLIIALSNTNVSYNAAALGPVFQSILLAESVNRLGNLAEICDKFIELTVGDVTDNEGQTLH